MSTETVPKGYKRTEVGVIPEEWEVKFLKEFLLSPPGYGINAPGVLDAGIHPRYLRITDITDDGRFFSPIRVAVVHPESSRYILSKNEIVFARTGASVGKSYLYNESDGELVFAGFLIRAKINSTLLSPKYLASFAHSEKYWNWVRLMSMRSGQPGINGREYAMMPFALPHTLHEQLAIAAALSDADALIESLEQLLAKKRQIKQGAMQELLTGKRRLPGFSGKWETKPLGGIGSFKNGINKSAEFFGRGVPFINLENVFGTSSIRSNADFNLIDATTVDLNTYDVRLGDVMFIRSSVKPSGVGLTAVIECDMASTVFSGFLLRFRDNDTLDIGFKKYCFYEAGFRSKVIGVSSVSANTNVNQDNLKRIELSFPTLPEQSAIASVLSDMDAELEVLEGKLEKARQVKQGMMQQLLTGKVRLV